MFKIKFIEDAATGAIYYIDKAVLANDEGPNENPKCGDWYEVDLQPTDLVRSCITGIDLIDYGDGTYMITEGLDPQKRFIPTDKPGTYNTNMVEAYTLDTEPETLIAPTKDTWVAGLKERDAIILEIVDAYAGQVDCCGEHSEEAEDMRKLLLKIKTKGISACRAQIEGYFADMYWAVGGSVEEHYSDFPELVRLIRKFVRLEDA